ncbi:hypothetical protein [uncultured Bifidobacterium sp.]|uniref:hypothetical protein n=1 Tax=uncultured Bifidobacterium sp. TaxID=165187 RepID=UPI00261E3CF1|nr:hypothetical protein [uncultured Bifidobacterium sp.]
MDGVGVGCGGIDGVAVLLLPVVLLLVVLLLVPLVMGRSPVLRFVAENMAWK